MVVAKRKRRQLF